MNNDFPKAAVYKLCAGSRAAEDLAQNVNSVHQLLELFKTLNLMPDTAVPVVVDALKADGVLPASDFSSHVSSIPQAAPAIQLIVGALQASNMLPAALVPNIVAVVLAANSIPASIIPRVEKALQTAGVLSATAVQQDAGALQAVGVLTGKAVPQGASTLPASNSARSFIAPQYAGAGQKSLGGSLSASIQQKTSTSANKRIAVNASSGSR